MNTENKNTTEYIKIELSLPTKKSLGHGIVAML